jgi:hypothetical protein
MDEYKRLMYDNSLRLDDETIQSETEENGSTDNETEESEDSEPDGPPEESFERETEESEDSQPDAPPEESFERKWFFNEELFERKWFFKTPSKFDTRKFNLDYFVVLETQQ